MILTTIKVHGQSAKRKEIMQTINDLARNMVSNEGCVRADLYVDLSDKDTFYLLEEWARKKEFEKHQQSKSIVVLLGLETLLVESLEITHAVRCNHKNQQRFVPTEPYSSSKAK